MPFKRSTKLETYQGAIFDKKTYFEGSSFTTVGS